MIFLIIIHSSKHDKKTTSTIINEVDAIKWMLKRNQIVKLPSGSHSIIHSPRPTSIDEREDEDEEFPATARTNNTTASHDQWIFGDVHPFIVCRFSLYGSTQFRVLL